MLTRAAQRGGPIWSKWVVANMGDCLSAVTHNNRVSHMQRHDTPHAKARGKNNELWFAPLALSFSLLPCRKQQVQRVKARYMYIQWAY